VPTVQREVCHCGLRKWGGADPVAPASTYSGFGGGCGGGEGRVLCTVNTWREGNQVSPSPTLLPTPRTSDLHSVSRYEPRQSEACKEICSTCLLRAQARYHPRTHAHINSNGSLSSRIAWFPAYMQLEPHRPAGWGRLSCVQRPIIPHPNTETEGGACAGKQCHDRMVVLWNCVSGVPKHREPHRALTRINPRLCLSGARRMEPVRPHQRPGYELCGNTSHAPLGEGPRGKLSRRVPIAHVLVTVCGFLSPRRASVCSIILPFSRPSRPWQQHYQKTRTVRSSSPPPATAGVAPPWSPPHHKSCRKPGTTGRERNARDLSQPTT